VCVYLSRFLYACVCLSLSLYSCAFACLCVFVRLCLSFFLSLSLSLTLSLTLCLPLLLDLSFSLAYALPLSLAHPLPRALSLFLSRLHACSLSCVRVRMPLGHTQISTVDTIHICEFVTDRYPYAYRLGASHTLLQILSLSLPLFSSLILFFS